MKFQILTHKEVFENTSKNNFTGVSKAKDSVESRNAFYTVFFDVKKEIIHS